MVDEISGIQGGSRFTPLAIKKETAQKICKDVLSLDDNIMLVRLFDSIGNALASAERKVFLQQWPASSPSAEANAGPWAVIVGGISKQVEQFFGAAKSVVISYTRMTIMLAPLASHNLYLVLLLRPSANASYILEKVRDVVGP